MPVAEPPRVIVFDVNETLSDLAPLRQRFEDLGLPAELAGTWFASVLRDGFALAVTGNEAPFGTIAATVLRGMFESSGKPDEGDAAVQHVLDGFASLDVHGDVAEGVRALRRLGLTLVTMTNGATGVARGLLERAGLVDEFARLMSVEAAGAWKPAGAAYRFAATECDVQPEEAMLVAVHPWDIDGAHRAGMQTAWLNRAGTSYPGHFAEPDVEVRELPQLAAALGTGNG